MRLKKINALNEIHKHICHSSAAVLYKNKIHKTTKNFYDFFNYLSFKTGTLIEVWLKVIWDNTMDVQNIYFGNKSIPYLYWTDK